MILTKDDILSLLSTTPPLVENLVDVETQVQPNGVDLSLSSAARFEGRGAIDYDNRQRVLPDPAPLPFDGDGWLEMAPGCYLVTYNETVNLPADVMAIGRPRSSMLRAGATVETAVWDAGYRGRSQSLLTVHNPAGLRLTRNARVVQLVFFRLSQETDGYTGMYQGENL
jgi:dUTP pyrophosphatase